MKTLGKVKLAGVGHGPKGQENIAQALAWVGQK
jgi:hypothetical protein